jgi:DNA invertase Pin-like site-specific DNA recombinase
MSGIRIGYARCSTDRQDLAAQREALVALGVAPDRIYTDHGLTGTARARPGLDQALAAVRGGDTLVVAKLDRLARSVPDARAIAETLAARGVRLAIGATVHDPEDPMGRMFFNILATFAEFEADLIRLRTREGMAIARARGRLRGKKPKLSDRQARELRRMHDTGDYSISDLAELFSVARPTVYRTLRRQPSPDSAPAAPSPTAPSPADATADAPADAPADPVPAGRSGQNRAGQTGQDRGAAASAPPDP